MKAAVFKELKKPLVVETVPDPTPGPNDVILKVGRCGICGSDLHISEDPVFGVPPGVVLGHEYSGEVVEVGREVKQFKTGDRIAAFPLESCGKCGPCLMGERSLCRVRFAVGGGGYGQYSKVEQHQCIPIPASVSLADAALVEPMAVGLHAVNVSHIRSGARVLVIGAGPIGLTTVFWARRMGAGKIAVTASSRTREGLAMEMGANAFIDPQAGLRDSIRLTNEALGGPPEIVYECVGKVGLVQRCVEHVAPRGNVVIVGLCTAEDHYQPFTVVQKQCSIIPSAFYEVRDFNTSLDVLEAGDTKPEEMVTDNVNLANMPAAFEALKHRTHQCKVLVEPNA
jgi:(R,R)-butanediol dehydrogenase/meso-butanediol dehydrogenase/diacetyl reductase